MRKKNLMKLNYRLLNQLADELKTFVKKHQGEKGFIDLRLQDDEKNNFTYDEIFSIDYTGPYESPVEVKIKAIRYNEEFDYLEVLYDECVGGGVNVVWSVDDIKNAEEDEWEAIPDCLTLDYVKTIFSITEFINEYV